MIYHNLYQQIQLAILSALMDCIPLISWFCQCEPPNDMPIFHLAIKKNEIERQTFIFALQLSSLQWSVVEIYV